MKRLNKIYSDIKLLKIQGATNIAKAGAIAYSLKPTKKTKLKLMSLRKTEPALFNTLKFMEKESKEKVFEHFEKSQEKINKIIFKIIKKGDLIYTHCHSSTISKALIFAKKNKKDFEISNTETRPRFQGRITAKELSDAGIKIKFYVDSGAIEAIESCKFILLGADAILKDGIINKVGSSTIAELAKIYKKPLYIISDSWKYYEKKIKIEKRDPEEVWKKAPKNVKIINNAFDKINKSKVNKIISELGNLSYSEFLKKIKK
jgi:ribose 1,5-bisphosphate isomerase